MSAFEERQEVADSVSSGQPWIIYEDRIRRGMGEVRVAVRLTNAVDEDLVRRGMLAPDQVRSYDTTALVDTGATHTIVPQEVFERLGLVVLHEIWVQFADGRAEMVGMTGPLRVEIQGRRALDEALVTGNDVLIGQTVLEKMDWSVDCRDQRLIQNPRHPNGPIFRI